MKGTDVIKRSTTQQMFFDFLYGLFFGAVFSYVVFSRFSSDDMGAIGYLEAMDNSLRSRQTFDLDINDPLGEHVEVNDGNKVSPHELSKFTAHEDTFTLGEHALSYWMSQHVRILCWVMTNPSNLENKTVHVKATWAKRCNVVLYVSSEVTDFPTIAVVDHEGREYLWQKTRGAFQYIFDHHLQDADWFLKADDDTFVIVENLRKLLSEYDPNSPIYFGRKFKPGFMSGGAGYVLSRGAVRLLVEDGYPDPEKCKNGEFVGGAEDVEIWKCLKNVGAEAGDSRTGERETFHPFVPQQMVVPNILPKEFWYWSYNFYEAKEGPECCSDYTISFHYVTPYMMYQLEYMVYLLRPFGVGYYTCPADIRSVIGLPEVVPQHSDDNKVDVKKDDGAPVEGKKPETDPKKETCRETKDGGAAERDEGVQVTREEAPKEKQGE